MKKESELDSGAKGLYDAAAALQEVTWERVTSARLVNNIIAVPSVRRMLDPSTLNVAFLPTPLIKVP